VSNVSVVRLKFRCNILIIGEIIKEMPGSVASGTLCIIFLLHNRMASVNSSFFAHAEAPCCDY